MTTDGQDEAVVPESSYIQFGLPDVPYSAIRIPMGADYGWYMVEAQRFREAYLEVFSPGQLSGNNPGDVALRQAAANVRQPQPGQTVSGFPAPQQQAPRGGGTGLWCPDHQVEMLKTSAQYDDTGDKFYHPLAEEDFYKLADGRIVRNHNLFRSKLLTQAPAF